MTIKASTYRPHRFPAKIISHAVCLTWSRIDRSTASFFAISMIGSM